MNHALLTLGDCRLQGLFFRLPKTRFAPSTRRRLGRWRRGLGCRSPARGRRRRRRLNREHRLELPPLLIAPPVRAMCVKRGDVVTDKVERLVVWMRLDPTVSTLAVAVCLINKLLGRQLAEVFLT